MYIYFKIQYFHGVKKIEEFQDTTIKLKGYDLGRNFY